MLEIEKGIPIPPRKCKTELAEVLQKMEVGDSIRCESESQSINAYATAHNLGIRTTRRKINGAWRVWRIA